MCRVSSPFTTYSFFSASEGAKHIRVAGVGPRVCVPNRQFHIGTFHTNMISRFCGTLRSSSALAFDASFSVGCLKTTGDYGSPQIHQASAICRTIDSHSAYGVPSLRLFVQRTVSLPHIPADPSTRAEKQILYSKSHEYLRFLDPNGPEAAAGISEFASEELGEIVFVEAVVSVDEGRDSRVKRGDPVCTLEALKSVAEVYAPLSGRILRFNPKLKENPGLINRDPEGEGWIFVMAVDPARDTTEVTTHSPQETARSLLLPPEVYAAHVLRESGSGAER